MFAMLNIGMLRNCAWNAMITARTQFAIMSVVGHTNCCRRTTINLGTWGKQPRACGLNNCIITIMSDSPQTLILE